MPLFQLKPVEERFLKICRNFTKKFEAIILCEGEEDAKTLKTLVAKMPVQIASNIAITDCGGFPTIREIARYAATLARLSRRLERIVLIVDANEHPIEQRLQSIVNSLRAHQVNVRSTEAIAESIYRIEVNDLEILSKIAGIMTLPFQSHAMEDYAAQLLVIRGKFEVSQMADFHKAKDFLSQVDEKAEEVIEQAPDELVQQAFENILSLLDLLS